MRFLQRIRHLPYRAMRRLAMVNRNIFFGLDSSSALVGEVPASIAIAQWSADDVRLHVSDDHYLSQDDATLLENGHVVCFAAKSGGVLAGYAWFAVGNVPGELNYDVHPDTRLPLFLPDDTAFVFHVFVTPEFRGKRIYAALIAKASHELSTRGISKLVLTTEACNESALRSVRRMGFTEIGQSWLFKVGPFCRDGYPQQPFFGGVRTGTYAGVDGRAARRK